MDSKANISSAAFGSYVDLVCDDAELQQSQFDKFFSEVKEEVRKPIEAQLIRTKEYCNALKLVYEKVQPSYRKINEGVYFPEKIYLFSLNLSKEDIRSVGYFNNLEECNESMSILEKAGYSTTECYLRTMFWKHIWS